MKRIISRSAEKEMRRDAKKRKGALPSTFLPHYPKSRPSIRKTIQSKCDCIPLKNTIL